MQCCLCNEILILPSDTFQATESKNFAVKYENKYICTGCHDVQLLFDDTPNKVSRKKIEPVKKKIIVFDQSPKYTCIKCQNIYEGSKCEKCQMLNPLFVRKIKNKKKKKR